MEQVLQSFRAMGTAGAVAQVIKPACGRPKDLAHAPEVLEGRTVGVEISGWLHRACKRGAKEVCEHGVSKEAVLYVTQRLSALMGEGARVVAVFDGDRSFAAKADTQEKRRLNQVRLLAAAGMHSTKYFQAKATPQEPLLKAIMAWCIANSCGVLVAAYEADQQLVDLQQQGRIDTILVGSNDSDLTIYGGTDCIYDYDPVARTCFHVRLLEDILISSPLDGAMNFNGWVYDRLLVLCLLSGHDYLPPIKGSGLKTVFKLMQRTALPPHLCLAPNACHPPLPERPDAWQTEHAIRFFAIGFLAAKLTPSEVEPHFQRLLMAYYAVRHHPVFRLTNAG